MVGGQRGWQDSVRGRCSRWPQAANGGTRGGPTSGGEVNDLCIPVGTRVGAESWGLRGALLGDNRVQAAGVGGTIVTGAEGQTAAWTLRQ